MGACNGKSDPPLTSEAAEPQKSVSPEIKDDDPIPMSEDDIERVCKSKVDKFDLIPMVRIPGVNQRVRLSTISALHF